MRNRRTKEADFEERRRRREENSELLRKIAERFESRDTERPKENNYKEKADNSSFVNLRETEALSSEYRRRSIEMSQTQKKALEQFFGEKESNSEEEQVYNSKKSLIENREKEQLRELEELKARRTPKIDSHTNILNLARIRDAERERGRDRKIREESYLSNLELDESEVVSEEYDETDVRNMNNIDLDGKPMLKEERLENIYDDETKEGKVKKGKAIYTALMIIEISLILLLIIYAVIRIKAPGYLKYISVVPVEKVVGLDKPVIPAENSRNEQGNETEEIVEPGKEKLTKQKMKITIGEEMKDLKISPDKDKIDEQIILFGDRERVEPDKQHLIIASKNEEGKLFNLKDLKIGQKIIVDIDLKRYEYKVVSNKILQNEKLEKKTDEGKQELTIITNVNSKNKEERIVIYADKAE